MENKSMVDKYRQYIADTVEELQVVYDCSLPSEFILKQLMNYEEFLEKEKKIEHIVNRYDK